MAIQGTQVLMYTKHPLFLYFSNFLFLYEKKINKTENKQKHFKQSKSIKLDWLNIKAKHISYADRKSVV